MGLTRPTLGALIGVVIQCASCADILDAPNFTPAEAGFPGDDAPGMDAGPDIQGVTDASAPADAGGCSETGNSIYYLYNMTPQDMDIPSGTWSSFVVQVVDVNLQPAAGVKVVFAQPTADPRFWVGESLPDGKISATQFAQTPGKQTETAALVDPTWPGMSGFGAGCVPTVAPMGNGDDLATHVSWTFFMQ
jgi:hypothetical protein